MATLPLGHLISPLTKEHSRQDRNTVHIGEKACITPTKKFQEKIPTNFIYYYLSFYAQVFLCVFFLAIYKLYIYIYTYNLVLLYLYTN